MSGFNIMIFFYGSMVGVPLLMWVLSVLSALGSLPEARLALGILIGMGSIIFGVIGIREVFVHGR